MRREPYLMAYSDTFYLSCVVLILYGITTLA
jgi:hypothetical protein